MVTRREFLKMAAALAAQPKQRGADRAYMKVEKILPDGTAYGRVWYKSGKTESYVRKGGDVFYANESGDILLPGHMVAAAEPHLRERWRLVESSYSTKLARIAKDFPAAGQYTTLAEKHARRYSLDPVLVMGVIKEESDFGRAMISEVGAAGEMQIIPTTARFLGMEKIFYPPGITPQDYDKAMRNFAANVEREQSRRKLLQYGEALKMAAAQREMRSLDDRFDPERNIEAGCRYLAYLRGRQFGESTELVLAAYSTGFAGSGGSYVKRVMDFCRRYL